jgi:hypothetical protein
MTITIASIALYVADKVTAQFIKDDFYAPIRNFLFPNKSYSARLQKVIIQTIQDYHKTNPEVDGIFPFYFSREIFLHLMSFVLFGGSSEAVLNELYQKSPQVQRPPREQLLAFFDYFVINAKGDKKLRKLFTEENYKQQIFAISETILGIDKKIDRILADQERSNRLKIDFYVTRSEDKFCKDLLKYKRVLLLTGISFCGKSQLAKMLCLEMIQEGYRFLNSNSIEQCQNELFRSQTPTVYLLEDPFGHIHDAQSASAWRKVQQLINDLPENHLLIITSRSELLQEINQRTSISQCSIGQHNWVDLTVSDVPFIMDYWEQLSKIKKLPEVFSEKFSTLLSEDYQGYHFQPGQLNHLANQPQELFAEKSLEQLVLIARSDSREIANSIILMGEKYSTLYMALGLSCDTIHEVSFDDLAYILTQSDSAPGFSKKETYFERKEKEGDAFPVYAEELTIEPFRHELSILQIRGYITITGTGIFFNHPTYKDVSRHLFCNERLDITDVLKTLLPRTCSSLNSKSILIAVQQIRYLYDMRADLKVTLRELAVYVAHHTIFPAVLGKVIEFLVTIIEDYDKDSQRDVHRIFYTRTDTSSIFWHKGSPFFRRGATNFDNMFGRRKSGPDQGDAILEEINSRSPMDTEKVWAFVNDSLTKARLEQLTDQGAQFLLSADDAFIRAKFALRVFRNGLPPQYLIKKIFRDEHPEVIVEAIKGIFFGLPAYSAEDIQIILPYMIEAVKNPGVIVRSSDYFCWFGLDHASEALNWRDIKKEQKQVAWSVWAKLFPIFLKAFPDYLDIPNGARFAANFHESVGYLSSNEVLEIGEIYYSWIDKRLHQVRDIDAHDLSIIQFVMEGSPGDSIERTTLLEKCITHSHTGFATYALKQVSWYWDKFNESDLDMVVRSVQSERADKRWLFATAVIRPEIPEKIQEGLFGQILLEKEPIEIIRILDPQLLTDALTVYVGSPQPLWWYAIHHSRSDKWLAILKTIIKEQVQPDFVICIRELITNMLNSYTPEWEDGYEIWEQVCKESRNDDALITELIRETAKSNYMIDPAKRLWKTLFDALDTRGDSESFEKEIINNIEALQSHGSRDFLNLIKMKLDPIIAALPLDSLIFKLTSLVKKSKTTQEDVEKAVNHIMRTSKNSPIRSSFSLDLIKAVREDHGQKFDSLKELDNLTDLTEIRSKEQLKALDDHYDLPDWVYLVEAYAS